MHPASGSPADPIFDLGSPMCPLSQNHLRNVKVFGRIFASRYETTDSQFILQ